jgi:carboxyl-terminal processing protease
MTHRLVVPASVCLAALACSNTAPVSGSGSAESNVAARSATETPSTPAVRAAPATPPAKPFAGGEGSFRTVRDTLLKNYPGAAPSEDELYRAAVEGMLEHVDPQREKWNKLLSPEDLDAIHTDLQGQVVGIGAEIHFDPATGYSDVLGVFAGSPAEKAKLTAGDKILDVNGKLFSGKTQSDVIAEIRGKAGETVTLTVLRADKLLTIPIVREVVNYEVVRDFMLPGGVGYLQIKSFNARTHGAIDGALADLASQHARALVVDMRGNPGGGFDDAVSCADAFLPAGATVVRVDKRDKQDQAFTAKTGATVLADAAMVVVVDGDTASSGEFVTAALQEARHATLVGSKTFGKWSLQRIDDLPNGYAIKYTVGVLRTASGKTYDGVGLSPDVEVDGDKKAAAWVKSMAGSKDGTAEKRLVEDAPLRTALALLRR